MRVPLRFLLLVRLVPLLVGAWACTAKTPSQPRIASPDPHEGRKVAHSGSSADAEPPGHSGSRADRDAGPHGIEAAEADAKVTASKLAEICSEAEAVAGSDRPKRSDAVANRSAGSSPALGVFAAPSRRYTMADLEALAKSGAHQELLQHIEDVAPVARNARWTALLAQAATAVVRAASTSKDPDRAFEGFMVAEMLVERHAALAKDEGFMAVRGSVGEKMLGYCFERSWSGAYCVESALGFVGVEGTTVDVRLAIAKLVRRSQNAHVAAPFFEQALASGDTTACSDPDLALSMTAALGLPPRYDNAKIARSIAERACFAELRPVIEKGLTSGEETAYFRDNVCAVLSAKGVVR
jgi:hypothetical protein